METQHLIIYTWLCRPYEHYIINDVNFKSSNWQVTNSKVEKNYYKGYINVGESLLEKIIVEVENVSSIKIRSVENIFKGISYSDGENGYFIADSFGEDSFDELICCFFFDERMSSNEYLIGVWSRFSYLDQTKSKYGRILFQFIRDIQKSEMIPEYYDLENKSLGDYIEDVSVINGIRKFFPIKEGMKFSERKSELISKKIEELSTKLSTEIKEIKVFQDQITQDLYELKGKLYGSKINSDPLIDLKFKVAKGDTKEVFLVLNERVNGVSNKSIVNDYILIYASYSELQQQSFLGTISREEYRVEINRINKSTLELIDKLIDIQQND